MDEHAILTALFNRLRHSGIPLGIRDYLDALRALDAGFGIGDRSQLRWLCEAVWSRQETETRAIRAVFDSLPRPTTEEVKFIAPAIEEIDADSDNEPWDRSTTPTPECDTPLETPDQDMPVEFVVDDDPGAHEIPAANVTVGPNEAFILTDTPIVTVRELVIAWRRYRKPLRCGPRAIVDIDATIRAQCRTGLLAEIALISARRNQARLIILVDVSDSMLPWHSFNAFLRESLPSAQLAAANVFYFNNVPIDVVFDDEALLEPQPVQRLLRRFGDSSLLVISDGGAARGTLSIPRVNATRLFLKRVRQHWSPVAWLNPMSPARWHGSSAESIGTLRGVAMFHLSDSGVIAAVDSLRGYENSVA